MVQIWTLESILRNHKDFNNQELYFLKQNVQRATSIELSNLSRSAVVEQRASVLNYLDGALDVYGLSVKQVVYWKFEKTHHISRTEISSHPEKFVETIRAIFGTGTSSIEKDMAREILHRAGLPHADSDDLVTALRKLDVIQKQRVN